MAVCMVVASLEIIQKLKNRTDEVDLSQHAHDFCNFIPTGENYVVRGLAYQMEQVMLYLAILEQWICLKRSCFV
ncbi:hypothetical protein NBG4_100008 [Candidatus Sulfobium mesophilum]|uniref:Uncharacterized protein n=1 Tax=Candidatus Sulfobium mesophilum TaxID=2016548 RepID=A0A2U3QDR9_9BACT|nr:hypothetical protein NBG4_100008 [Candidatus Sulfobium mesophilum]